MNADFMLLLRLIDECLMDLGTTGLVDGRKARDKLLDVRSLVSAMSDEGLVESITEEV